MKAEIITIGDEILIGQIVDTNSAFLGKRLSEIGVSVFQITSIQDDKSHILQALQQAEKNADIVIITGGLGPTKDDITKHTLCEYFEDTLVENKAVLAHVEAIFKKYISTPISDLNRQQALVPSKAQVLKNEHGTAPGMWIEKNNTVFVSLPGVPFEMKALITNQVIPKLTKRFNFPYIVHKTLLTEGLGESAIADRLDSFETNLPKFIKLAYLPSLGRVRLRLSAIDQDKLKLDQELDKQVHKLLELIEDIFVDFEDQNSIEVNVGKLLKEQNKTIAIAESCTGGNIAQSITVNAGASEYFKGSVVSYSTASKQDILKVPKSIIETYSVVSTQVAEAMAKGALDLYKSDIAISTTGNAGPTKGNSDKEIGTVCIAIVSKDKVFSQVFNFGKHRERVIKKATHKVFELLRKEFLKK